MIFLGLLSGGTPSFGGNLTPFKGCAWPESGKESGETSARRRERAKKRGPKIPSPRGADGAVGGRHAVPNRQRARQRGPEGGALHVRGPAARHPWRLRGRGGGCPGSRQSRRDGVALSGRRGRRAAERLGFGFLAASGQGETSDSSCKLHSMRVTGARGTTSHDVTS